MDDLHGDLAGILRISAENQPHHNLGEADVVKQQALLGLVDHDDNCENDDCSQKKNVASMSGETDFNDAIPTKQEVNRTGFAGGSNL